MAGKSDREALRGIGMEQGARNKAFRKAFDKRRKDRKLTYEMAAVLLDVGVESLRRYRNNPGSIKLETLRKMVDVGLLKEEDIRGIVGSK